MSSSVNPHYTFNYSQPEEYHFSHDSVFFPRRLFEMLQHVDLSQLTALDICAGSGIVGLDFLFHRQQAGQSLPQQFDFLEIQPDYRPHFLENQMRGGLAHAPLTFVNRNYDDLQKPEFKDKYDLVVSAPPYFLTSQGKLSPNQFRNRCRFFIDSSFANLILGILSTLRMGGVAYLLLRDLPDHKWDMIAEARSLLADRLQMEVLGDVLGTPLVRLEKTTAT